MTDKVIKAYVETTRGQIHYRQAGTGRPVILLQLLPFGSRMFEPVMPLLADKGYACYAFDLMGYGRSDERDGEWLVGDFSDNLLEAFDRLSLQPEILVGGHFTSLIAADIALRRPDQIKKLVLDGIPVWDADERLQRFAKNITPDPMTEDGTAVLGLWKQTYGMLTKLDPDAKLALSSENDFLESFVAFVRATYKPGTAKAFFEFDTDKKLAALSQFVLIVGSPTDTLAGYHEAAMKLVPNATEHLFDKPHPLYRMTGDQSETDLHAYADMLARFIEQSDG